ncbi:MAG: GTP cyclohydrolase I, partial [Usitatibacteraceae bacterium]
MNLQIAEKHFCISQETDPSLGEPVPPRPTQAEVEAAVRTLIAATGDDPRRQGLVDTPARVARAYGEWFAGYDQEPSKILSRTFDEADGYQEMVLLRSIPLVS